MNETGKLQSGQEIELTIERLAGLGDGVATHAGRDIFVPLTAPGDRIRARIGRINNKAVRAEVVKLLSAGEERIDPACRHFGDCGGCELQHLAADRYRAFKEAMLRQAVARAGYDPGLVEPVAAVAPGSRRRADLAVSLENGQVRLGFRARGSHRVVGLRQCPVLLPELEAMLPVLTELIGTLPRPEILEGLLLTAVDGGLDLLFYGPVRPELSSLPALQDFAAQWRIMRIAWRAVGDIHLLLESAPVQVKFGGINVALPPGAFLQATRAGEEMITEAVLSAAEGARNAVDLYAGCGAFSLPLAARGVKVRAFEGDTPMVTALNNAFTLHADLTAGNATVRDLFNNPVQADEMGNVDFAVIDPPRNGAEPQVRALAQARVPRLAMVSCNPRALERDGAVLRAAGYRLERARPIDQFLWSTHLEAVAVFSRSPE